MFPFFQKEGRGQGLVEYALILVLVALVAILSVTLFGSELTNAYDDIVHAMGNEDAPDPTPSPTPLPGFLTPPEAVNSYCTEESISSGTIVNVYHSLTIPTVYYVAGIHGTGDWPPEGFAEGHDHYACP